MRLDRRFWTIWLVAFLLASLVLVGWGWAAARAGPLGINPSSQMHNEGVDRRYIEGEGMKDVGDRLQAALAVRGLDGRVYWSRRGDGIEGLIIEVEAANRDRVTAFLALHSDSAGAITNRLLSLYLSDDGYRLGSAIGSYVSKRLGFNFIEIRRSDLYVLRHSKAPAALFEILNHSSPIDVQRLLDPGFRQQVAEAFADAYVAYLGNPAPAPRPAPIPPSPAITVVPWEQRQGPAVRDLQDRIANFALYDISIDSQYGPQTRAGIIAFQRDHHLYPDGIAGKATWTAARDPRTVPRTVGYGDLGRAVRYLQSKLNQRYPGWRLLEDGVAGRHTDSAIHIHQRLSHLIEDGRVGEQTWRSLLAGER